MEPGPAARRAGGLRALLLLLIREGEPPILGQAGPSLALIAGRPGADGRRPLSLRGHGGEDPIAAPVGGAAPLRMQFVQGSGEGGWALLLASNAAGLLDPAGRAAVSRLGGEQVLQHLYQGLLRLKESAALMIDLDQRAGQAGLPRRGRGRSLRAAGRRGARRRRMSAISRILAIESSCDEFGAAVIGDGVEILSNVVASQVEIHARTGGVVPEVAGREHLRNLAPVVEAALERAGTGWEGIDAIAVTQGPGLGGSLLVGANAAKALAWSRRAAADPGPPHRGPHLRQLAAPGPGRVGRRAAALPGHGPGRLRRPHGAVRHAAAGRSRRRARGGADRPDAGRRGRRGLRQGRAAAGAALPRRPGDRAGGAPGRRRPRWRRPIPSPALGCRAPGTFRSPG